MKYTPAICKCCSTEVFVDVNMVMIKDDLWEKVCDNHEDLICEMHGSQAW